MKKTLLLPVFISVFLLSNSMQSCSKYTVTTNYNNTADLVYQKRVATTYFWGIVNKPHTVVDTTCGKCGLSEVKVTSGLGYSVINVVTLGIVHIVRIETKCQKDPPVIGQ
jgi:hypothetical protein